MLKIYSHHILFLIIVLLGGSNAVVSQNKAIWSGNYVLKSSKAEAIDSIRIRKAKDANKDDLASRFESDLSRWKIASKNDNYEDELIARRFLFDIESYRNEYEQFGWTTMHSKGEIECIDAGHFFMCQTTPNSQVKIDDEAFFTKTGVFGIRLHYGLFELEKYE
ncbi:phosphate ABC transporter permease [Tamlana sp. 2_MG-2023]|uniref:phosphate ABC transporter permease n=1 Tax=unclassified Tamlana TaxID=2614803 RepID=UPI0026E22AF3|nr:MULTISPECIES: phosphate ABC transporter permease [unclassified Tamlana]MDO6759911.1 phosphate ABC transporter permease [Tamlana sp. 2_MG-2023]MDO6791919.1 phosphate ABC transporter permease [Tamlana sp. 1_MG-2023]